MVLRRALALLLASATLALAQDENVSFVIAVSDRDGRPVSDLTRDEIVLNENGSPVEIAKVQPFTMPLAVTIAVDNGPLSADALGHYRTGLTNMLRTLPGDMEISLMTMAPQPMAVVPHTTDRTRLLRGVTLFAPQEESPRFTDTLVEFAKRYETALKETNRIASIPVLVLLSTSAPEATSYEAPEITRALSFLERRRAIVHVVMLNVRRGTSVAASINDGRQTLIGIPATKVTRGRYESISASSRLTTLLPELGGQIAALHRKHANQLLITARRPAGTRGPLRNPQIGLTRTGLTGSVSLDGLP